MALFLSDLRKEYNRARLLKENADANPIAQFTRWFEEALAQEVYEPNAMALATVSPDGRPSVRMVLLKGYDQRGFCFYTNYASRKGRDLAANPHTALTFWWGPLERQVRIEGTAERLTPEESDSYYNSRPLGSRLGALVSDQSTVIEDRTVLEERLRKLQEQYVDEAPPRPEFWGGYRVAPAMIEFWQGGPHRLHDRLCYTRQENGDWSIARLSP